MIRIMMMIIDNVPAFWNPDVCTYVWADKESGIRNQESGIGIDRTTTILYDVGRVLDLREG